MQQDSFTNTWSPCGCKLPGFNRMYVWLLELILPGQQQLQPGQEYNYWDSSCVASCVLRWDACLLRASVCLRALVNHGMAQKTGAIKTSSRGNIGANLFKSACVPKYELLLNTYKESILCISDSLYQPRGHLSLLPHLYPSKPHKTAGKSLLTKYTLTSCVVAMRAFNVFLAWQINAPCVVYRHNKTGLLYSIPGYLLLILCVWLASIE